MRRWKIAIAKDSSRPMLGLHGLHNAFRGLPGVEVAALFDRHEDNAKKVMEVIGAQRHYTDYPAMLDRERPDIVVLCSRHPFDHLPQIAAAAERGIHIYCEKPMTVSLEEADAIIALTEKHHIKLCMAHPARYSLAFRTMKAMIEAGEIGVPVRAHGRGKCDHRGGGEDLVVLGTHILDLMAFFLGAPEYVWADVTVNGRPVGPTDRSETVEPLGPLAGDEVFAYFRFPNCVSGTFDSRRGLFNPVHQVVHMGITAVGTAGALSMRFNDNVPVESRLRISRVAAPPEDHASYEDVELVETRVIPDAAALDYAVAGLCDIPQKPLFMESNRFAAWDLMQAIVEDRLPESNQYHARIAQEMIHGIYAAHLAGMRTRLPLPCRKHPLECLGQLDAVHPLAGTFDAQRIIGANGRGEP